jgi:hemerythrin-like domain-containing protein
MNRIRVSDILATIREDHELVAEQLGILKTLEGSIADAEGRHLEKDLELLRDASRFFQTKLFPHFEQEEHGLFVLLRDRLPRGSTLTYELEAEHEQMRKLCERLREELSWLRHEKHRKQPVLSDLAQLCARIAGLLTRHAEREERLVAQYLSDQVSPDAHCAYPRTTGSSARKTLASEAPRR